MQEEEEEAEDPHGRVEEDLGEEGSDLPRAEFEEDDDDEDNVPLIRRTHKRPHPTPLDEGASLPVSAPGARSSSAQPIAAEPLRAAHPKRVRVGWVLPPVLDDVGNVVPEAAQASSSVSSAAVEASPMRATTETTVEVAPAASDLSLPFVPAVEKAAVATEDAAAEVKPSVDERAADFEHLLKEPIFKAVDKLLSRCARYKIERDEFEQTANRVTVEKKNAEAQAAKLEKELTALRKDFEVQHEDLETQRWEAERLRKEEEQMEQSCGTGAIRLRSLAGALAGAVGRTAPSGESEGSNILHGAIKSMGDSVKLAKMAAMEASSVLKALHEGVFPDKAVPSELEALASSFDKRGDFLFDFARDNTVSGLETTLMVLLGHGVAIDFDTMLSTVPKYTAAHYMKRLLGHANFRRRWRGMRSRKVALPRSRSVAAVVVIVLSR